MTTLNVNLPNSLHHNASEWASREGISIDQFISSAVAEKLAALETEEYILKRASRGSLSEFNKALAEVPDVPDEFDRS